MSHALMRALAPQANLLTVGLLPRTTVHKSSAPSRICLVKGAPVAAYGLPIEEMTRGVSQWIWPLYLPEQES